MSGSRNWKFTQNDIALLMILKAVLFLLLITYLILGATNDFATTLQYTYGSSYFWCLILSIVIIKLYDRIIGLGEMLSLGEQALLIIGCVALISYLSLVFIETKTSAPQNSLIEKTEEVAQ